MRRAEESRRGKESRRIGLWAARCTTEKLQLEGMDEAEQQRKYKLSPNTSKFNDINELSIAMNIQYK